MIIPCFKFLSPLKKDLQLWTDILSWVAASETARLKPTASWASANVTQVKPTILVPDYIHCNENPIYLSFLFWKLRGLSPNFHIHVSVSGLYIPKISPHIFLWKLGLWQRQKNSFSGNICFEFSVLVLCSVEESRGLAKRLYRRLRNLAL
jgi:hypothetical protein